MILHQVANSRGNYNYNAFIYNNIFWQQHFHANYELIYVFENTTDISVNGETQTLQKGEIILLPPYTVHSLSVKNGKTWVGVFSEDFIISFAQKHRHKRFSKLKLPKNIQAVLEKNLFVEEIPEHFLLISYLYMVCNECIKNVLPTNNEQDNKFMFNVITYISENLNRDITLKEIAEKMNYEYHYFSSLFHRCFSINFKSFVNQIRFEKACSLLSDKSNTITFIAQSCGFGSIRNFNRAFKNLSGFTPTEYRKAK